ncbi:hypothetical protein KZJ38_21875 [Paraburkholderia edwinii]|jgi:hypothetical protein|uniref:Type III secretion system major needle protein (YscF/MxiH/PrgI family) n=1 Tax=Paraburkholderia edwinii TaxID=2861782 RepID=A0ABX8UIM3_9BURK|nr:hypothetical protein [Paraburkholderia edwinii]QYD68826.1 hypothetical protein KZJ38_21875 [Paraburkholderia edwinii]
MVPLISAIAVPETFATTLPFEPAGNVEPAVRAGRAAFADSPPSPGIEWIADAEANSRMSELNLDSEMKRVLSGDKLMPADMLRLRNQININTETHMLCKKVSDSLVQGVQTLARG